MREYMKAVGAITAFGFAILFVLGGGVQQLAESPARFWGYAQTAAVWFVPGITTDELRVAYAEASEESEIRKPQKKEAPFASVDKVHILIMPGHEPGKAGTEFNGVFERDLVVDIADALADILAANPRYEVMVARTKTAWHPTLAEFFTTRRNDILSFREEHKAEMETRIHDGTVQKNEEQLFRTDAPLDILVPIYGVNLFAREHGTHITLHLHLNDYGGRTGLQEGEHTGFSIYVPEKQYATAEASRNLAEHIATRLSAYHATSTLPSEASGIAEDQELGALGAYNTIDHASVLIEYGYIYEPQFMNPKVRSIAIADYAYQTYLGLQDFFQDPVENSRGSISFPYTWTALPQQGPETYALQAALHYLSFYPAPGESFSDCPITGTFGPCTKRAVAAYQVARGLSGEGVITKETIETLTREVYGVPQTGSRDILF